MGFYDRIFGMPLLINGQTIDDSAIDQEFSAIKAHYESLSSISCCERDDEFRGYAKENIIFRALLTQEAERTIPEPSDEEVSRAFQKLKDEHGGSDQFYANMGLVPDQDELIRDDLRLNLKVESLREKTCSALATPTEEECRSFYDQNIEQYSEEEEVRASHIFKSVRKTEERETIFKNLCEVRQKLVGGADFNQLACKHSDKPEEEIDLGFFKRGELMDEFEIVTFSMQTGEISPIFATPHGFHLAKVTERKTGSPKPFKSVRENIEAEIIAQRQDAKLQKLVDELKKSAKVEYIEPEEPINSQDHN